MRDFLLIDTETTGLDPETGHLLEVAGVLYDPGLGVVTRVFSALVEADIETNEAELVNRIPAAAVRPGRVAMPREDASSEVHAMWCVGGCGPILAHNAAFDRSWLPELADEHDWICTKDDAEWPRMPGGTGSLVSIALAYDLGVARAHRAVEDCLLLAALLTRVHELEGGLDDWLARATEERVELQAMVSYGDRGLAKAAGFRWDADRKVWHRRVRVSRADAFVAGLPFGVAS